MQPLRPLSGARVRFQAPPVLKLPQRQQRIPVLRFLQQALGSPHAQLGLRLGGVGPAVPGQIQLAGKHIFTAPLFQLPEISLRPLEYGSGRAFQIAAAKRGFHKLSGGAAASVAVAVGIDHPFGPFVLDPVLFPAADHVPGRDPRIVLLISMRQDPCAVNSLPPEIIVREGLAFRILPDQLLGGKIGHAAPGKDLGKRRRKAEAVRQPGHPAVRAELLLKPFLSVQKLSDQAFPAGHVGIAFHVERAVRDHPSFRGPLLHPLPKLRIGFLQIFQHRRLAEQELIFRIFLHQRQLIAVGTRRLAPGLLQRPQPGQIQMGLAENGELRRGGAVGTGKKRL